jgi:hypothetical protein
MRKNAMLLVATFALSLSPASAGAAMLSTGTLPPGLTPLLGPWDCETTMANGSHYRQTDSIESIGQWLHGTARPQPGYQQPYYDYYITHEPSGWVYIQIDPFHSDPSKTDPEAGTYFVGTSKDGAGWNIVYPAGQGSYTFTNSANQFKIAYGDLTEVCNRSNASVAKPPVLTLKCDTSQTGQNASAENYLTVSRVDPSWWKGVKSWWQGAGIDSPTGGNASYEYNFFPISGQWVSVAINGSTGDYFIARSYKSRTLNNTTWTVIYPSVAPGFTFEDVYPENALPQGFSIVFSDGYQTCCPVGTTQPCPPPQYHQPAF